MWITLSVSTSLFFLSPCSSRSLSLLSFICNFTALDLLSFYTLVHYLALFCQVCTKINLKKNYLAMVKKLRIVLGGGGSIYTTNNFKKKYCSICPKNHSWNISYKWCKLPPPIRIFFPTPKIHNNFR